MPSSPSIEALLQQAREQESRRIGAQLHDELGGQLLGLKLALNRIACRLESAIADSGTPPLITTDAVWLGEQLRYLETVAHAALEATGRISRDLSLPALQAGLPAALRKLCAEFARQSGVRCDYAGTDAAPPLDARQNQALYLICREALNNVGKHAQATFAKIQLMVDVSGVHLKISDNGIGITPAHVPGLGLSGMAARAHEIGASLRQGDGNDRPASAGNPGTSWEVFLPASHGAGGDELAAD